MEFDKEIFNGLWDMFNKKRLIDEYFVKNLMSLYSPTEIYILDILGCSDTNITKIAEALYMTRGAISKLAKRLESRGVIETYKRDDNKKEVYLRLTFDGKKDFKRHCKIREALSDSAKSVYRFRSQEQIDDLGRIIGDYNKYLDVQIKRLGVSLT